MSAKRVAVALAALALGAAVLILARQFALCGLPGSAMRRSDRASSALPATYVAIDVFGTAAITISSYEDGAKEAIDAAFDAASDIDARMSAHLPDSEISAFNASSLDASAKMPQAGVQISQDTHELIMLALEVSRLSRGAFDITIGPAMELWRANGSFSRLPEPWEIESSLPLIGYGMLELSDAPPYAVRPAKPGMRIDLGGIAKGHACDVAVERLLANGVESALLDFGGNVYAMGSKPGGEAWTVGIRAPFAASEPKAGSGTVPGRDDEYGSDTGPVPGRDDEHGSDTGAGATTDAACVMEARDVAVVTSGAYERFFVKDGATYGHILDPKTGYPADSGLLSATIVDASSARADALSTACFVLGLEASVELVESLPGCEGVFIDESRVAHLTSGLAGKVFLTDERFVLQAADPPTGQ